MPLYHVNVPQYDDVLNNKNVYNSICWKLVNLEVISNQSYNQTDLQSLLN